jgi:hypothetical protein
MTNAEHEDGYETVARYHVETEADQAVEALVLRGVGALIERGEHEAPFALVVVAADANRAREILGLPQVASTEAPRVRDRLHLVWMLVIFAAALIILPVIAFFVTFKLSGG